MAVPHQNDITACWHRIVSANKGGTSVAPGARGGHAMCIDDIAGQIYMFGGYDGTKDLSDLWMFDIKSNTWTCLCEDSSKDGGPKPTSCHTMCIDKKHKKIYTIGRFVEESARNMRNCHSDFFCYDVTNRKWIKLSDSTRKEGGPNLVHGTSMCIDSERQLLFIYGGIVIARSIHVQYSGFFVYDITNNKWFEYQRSEKLPDRNGHAMAFHPQSKKIYIFSGVGKSSPALMAPTTAFADMVVIDTSPSAAHSTTGHVVTPLNQPSSDSCPFVPRAIAIEPLCPLVDMDVDAAEGQHPPQQVPPAGFTHRFTIDTEANEITLFVGRDDDAQHQKSCDHARLHNGVWVYSIKNNQWKCAYDTIDTSAEYWSSKAADVAVMEPAPRFASQVVYDQMNKTHYMFGGSPTTVAVSTTTPGKPQPTKEASVTIAAAAAAAAATAAARAPSRLDDFWSLKLISQHTSESTYMRDLANMFSCGGGTTTSAPPRSSQPASTTAASATATNSSIRSCSIMPPSHQQQAPTPTPMLLEA